MDDEHVALLNRVIEEIKPAFPTSIIAILVSPQTGPESGIVHYVGNMTEANMMDFLANVVASVAPRAHIHRAPSQIQ